MWKMWEHVFFFLQFPVCFDWISLLGNETFTKSIMQLFFLQLEHCEPHTAAYCDHHVFKVVFCYGDQFVVSTRNISLDFNQYI